MGRRNETTNFYTFDNLLKYNCSYSWAIGERSNGKTFDGKKRCIDVASNDRKFVLLKRRHTQITRAKMIRFFEDIEGKLHYGIEKLGDYIKYSTEHGFYIIKGNEIKNIGYAMAIEDMYDTKGDVFNDVDLILFDEVIEDGNYLQNEIVYFMNTISTVVRNRPDICVLMTANTVSRYCPYFDLFGIDITKLKKGTIGTVIHKKGATVAVEYCKTFVSFLGEKKKHKYLGFDDNSASNMILHGDWQYNDTNTKDIDGIGWNCKRYKIYGYVTFISDVYEMSLYLDKNPIAFIRSINTQNGKVSKHTLYNFSADNSLILTNENGIVPKYNALNKFIDENTRERINILMECIKAGRVVFDNTKTGTEFILAIQKLRFS